MDCAKIMYLENIQRVTWPWELELTLNQLINFTQKKNFVDLANIEWSTRI